jgi:sterol desaturase/sphingolipid hydroxylase (fatty acid hydroxylase superfamily)
MIWLDQFGYQYRHLSTLLIAGIGYRLPVHPYFIVSSLWWLTCNWVSVFFFMIMDTLCTHINRIALRTTIPFSTMCRVALRNQLISLCISGIFFNFYDITQYSTTMDGVTWTISFFFLFDLVFYTGHALMHWIPPIYQIFHKDHHQTFGDIAISYHYMTVIDFLLEVTLPSHLPLLLIGIHPSLWLAFIGFGTWNGIVVHSGWNLPFCPNPSYHLLHHQQYNQNLGGGPIVEVYSLIQSCIMRVKSALFSQDHLKKEAVS